MRLYLAGQFDLFLLLMKIKLGFVSSVVKSVHDTSGGLGAKEPSSWMEIQLWLLFDFLHLRC